MFAIESCRHNEKFDECSSPFIMVSVRRVEPRLSMGISEGAGKETVGIIKMNDEGVTGRIYDKNQRLFDTRGDATGRDH